MKISIEFGAREITPKELQKIVEAVEEAANSVVMISITSNTVHLRPVLEH